jgi:hypothetical protein
MLMPLRSSAISLFYHLRWYDSFPLQHPKPRFAYPHAILMRDGLTCFLFAVEEQPNGLDSQSNPPCRRSPLVRSVGLKMTNITPYLWGICNTDPRTQALDFGRNRYILCHDLITRNHLKGILKLAYPETVSLLQNPEAILNSMSANLTNMSPSVRSKDILLVGEAQQELCHESSRVVIRDIPRKRMVLLIRQYRIRAEKVELVPYISR